MEAATEVAVVKAPERSISISCCSTVVPVLEYVATTTSDARGRHASAASEDACEAA